MANNKEKAGIRIKNSHSGRIKGNHIYGFETGINIENTTDLKLKNNLVSRKHPKSLEEKWYKDRNFWISIIAIVVAVLIGWIWH